MKKLLGFVLSAVMIVGLVTGCNSSNKTNDQPGKTQTEAQTTAGTGSEETKVAADTSGLDFGEYSADKPLQLTISHFAANETNQLHLLAAEFKELVESASGGAVEVEIVMGGVLGNDDESLQSVMAGALNMAVNNTPIMSSYYDKFQVLDLPYLFTDYDHIYAFLESDICQSLMSEFGEATGARMLCMQAVGYRNLESSKGFVSSLADVSGLKTRCTSSDVYVSTWKTWGANALTMAGSEVTTALQQGTIDACDNVNNVAYAEAYYDFAGKITVMEYAVHFNGLTINNKLFGSLTADLQKVISDSAIEAATTRTKALEKGNADALEKMEAAGAQVYTMTDAEKAAFVEAAQPVYDSFVGKFGSDAVDAIKGLK